MHAAYNNSVRSAQILLAKEAKITTQTGYSALMYAAISGNVQMAKLLMGEAGLVTTTNTVDFPKGPSALLMALQQGSTGVV